jgi:hypothetical protein
MQWLTANWFWVVIGGLFIGMHLFGHGGHGAHGGGHGERRGDERDTGATPNRVETRSGHHH